MGLGLRVLFIFIVLLIIYQLYHALRAMITHQPASTAMVKSLTRRVGLSLFLFLFLFWGAMQGWWHPHGLLS
jgi:hypothetical protein